MAYLNNDVYDAALNEVKNNVAALYLCSSEPADYNAATSTAALGSASGAALPAITGPADKSGGGREITVGAVATENPGSVTATGTATHFALVDNTEGEERLLSAQALNESQSVTNGNTFTLTSHKIGIPGAV